MTRLLRAERRIERILPLSERRIERLLPLSERRLERLCPLERASPRELRGRPRQKRRLEHRLDLALALARLLRKRRQPIVSERDRLLGRLLGVFGRHLGVFGDLLGRAQLGAKRAGKLIGGKQFVSEE